MALNKIGLSYYSVDTDRYQDIRIKKLKKCFGTDGLAIYDFILCEVYRVKGCFLVWDESTVFDVADYFNAKETLINEVVNYCAVVGLFHKGLLDRERIITSQSIQSRYLDACTRAKRKEVKIPEKYAAIPEEVIKIPEQSDIPPEESHQSKVKDSKVEERKVKNGAKALAVASNVDMDRRRELKKVYNKLTDNLNPIDIPGTWSTIKTFILDNKPDWAEPYVDAWNVFANTYKLSKVEMISDGRRKKFGTRITEPGFDFLRILEKIKTSSHLKGDNNGNWKCSFDWILENDKNYLKILEGNYN